MLISLFNSTFNLLFCSPFWFGYLLYDENEMTFNAIFSYPEIDRQQRMYYGVLRMQEGHTQSKTHTYTTIPQATPFAHLFSNFSRLLDCRWKIVHYSRRFPIEYVLIPFCLALTVSSLNFNSSPFIRPFKLNLWVCRAVLLGFIFRLSLPLEMPSISTSF